VESVEVWQLVSLVVLLALSAFFSASETALMSLNKVKLRNMVEADVWGAARVQRLIGEPGKLLSAILVGNNVVNIGASALATAIAIQLFGSTGVGIATGVMTLLVLIFGEITPKTLAAAYPERIATLVSRPIAIVTYVLTPVISVLTYVTKHAIKIFGGKIDVHRPLVTEDELKTMVDMGHEEGVLDVEKRKMIHNVFQFGDSLAKDAMVPRPDIVAVEVNSSYDEIMKVFKKKRHSRMPVFRNSIDSIIGMLHIKDVIAFEEAKDSFLLANHLREIHYTFEGKKIAELFEEMRKKRLQMVAVADEYGGTAGIITVQDLVEEIFGDIGDEYAAVSDSIRQIGEDDYLIDGMTRLSVINEKLPVHLESEYAETINGYITGLIGRFPKKGEVIENEQIRCIVIDVHKYRIKRIRLKVKPAVTAVDD